MSTALKRRTKNQLEKTKLALILKKMGNFTNNATTEG
jgi:hypothetical protein